MGSGHTRPLIIYMQYELNDFFPNVDYLPFYYTKNKG